MLSDIERAEFAEIQKEFSEFILAINKDMTQVPKVSAKTLGSGKAELYVEERLKEIMDCIKKHDGVMVHNPERKNSGVWGIYSRDDTILENITKDITVDKHTFDFIVASLPNKGNGSFFVSIFVHVLPRKFININSDGLSLIGMIDSITGIAYDRAVSLAEYETRWTLQIIDGIDSHEACERARTINAVK